MENADSLRVRVPEMSAISSRDMETYAKEIMVGQADLWSFRGTLFNLSVVPTVLFPWTMLHHPIKFLLLHPVPKTFVVFCVFWALHSSTPILWGCVKQAASRSHQELQHRVSAPVRQAGYLASMGDVIIKTAYSVGFWVSRPLHIIPECDF